MNYGPKSGSRGGTLQAGIPFGQGIGTRAGGILVRGVVIATYVYDSPQHPFSDDQPAAIYCDVLAYTQLTGGRTYVIKNVLVTQEFASIQSGVTYQPRAATQTISGAPLDPTGPIDPTQLDGDHVVVGFLDDRRFQPVLLRALPHPNLDIGQETDSVGRRTRLVLADGQPLLWAHHQVAFGVTDDGSWVVDTSKGNAGGISPTGQPIPSPGGGSVTHRAKLTGSVRDELVDTVSGQAAITSTLSAAGLSISFGALPGSFTVTGAQGPILAIPAVPTPLMAVQIGAGSNPQVSSEGLVKYLVSLVAWLAAHTHVSTAPGTPTSPPPPTPAVPPATPAQLQNPSFLGP